MITLPSVRLMCVDTVRPYKALESMRRSMLWVRFHSAILLTDTDAHHGVEKAAKAISVQVIHHRQSNKGITFQGIARNFFVDYETALLCEPVKFYPLGVGHILFAEWDSGVLNPLAWRKEFLEYDFIGAPWPIHRDPGWPKCDGLSNAVGNTGFSLRSTKFSEAVARHFRMSKDIRRFSSDRWACRTMRPILEKEGVLFAPVDVAAQFSCEDRVYDGAFGFHGRSTVAINGWGGWFTEQFGER